MRLCAGRDRRIVFCVPIGTIHRALSRAGPELDSIKIERAVADDGAQSKRGRASGRTEFDFDLRVQRQIRDCKQAHPNIADVDSEGFDAAEAGEHPDGSVEQLAFSSPPVLPGIEFEKHGGSNGNIKVAHDGSCAEITKGSVLGRSRTIRV